MDDYVRWIRRRVGQERIQLHYAAGCIVDNGRVLLQRRSDDGKWGFPGGIVELGESVHDALVREVREETGLEVRVDVLQGIYSAYYHRYPNGDEVQAITTFARCSVVSGVLTPEDETLELRYWPLDGEVPSPLSNLQHSDAFADLRAGRTGVMR